MKKGDAHVMWIIVGLVLALLVLAVFSFVTGGIVKKVLTSIGVIHGDSQNAVACMVTIPGTNGDSDRDGIKDIPECDKYKNENNIEEKPAAAP